MISPLTIARLKAGIRSGAEAAQRLGIGEATLYRYESGKTSPRLDDLERMADVYGVTLDQLAGRSPLPSEPAA